MAGVDDFDLYVRSARTELHREAYRLCRDWYEAEDLVQVALHRLYLRQLAPRQRTAIMLRYWLDLSIEQIAAILNCSPGTVTSQSCRALARLRTLLAESGLCG